MTRDASTILVTGGSRGIGRAIVRLLAQAGRSVAFTYRENRQAAEQLVDELSPSHPRIAALRCDSRDLDAVRATGRAEDVEALGGEVARGGRSDPAAGSGDDGGASGHAAIVPQRLSPG